MSNTNSNTSHYQQRVATIMQLPVKKQATQFIKLIKFMEEVIESRDKQLESVEATVDDLVINTGLDFSTMRELSTSMFLLSYDELGEGEEKEYCKTFYMHLQSMLEKLQQNQFLRADNLTNTTDNLKKLGLA